jgi:hypothetical protein
MAKLQHHETLLPSPQSKLGPSLQYTSEITLVAARCHMPTFSDAPRHLTTAVVEAKLQHQTGIGSEQPDALSDLICIPVPD